MQQAENLGKTEKKRNFEHGNQKGNHLIIKQYWSETPISRLTKNTVFINYRSQQ